MKIYRKDIQNIVNEAIEELVRKGVSIAPTQVNVPDAKAPKNQKLLGKPICSSAFYSKPDANGNEALTVRLKNIHAQHQSVLQNEWNQKYGQIFTTRVNQSQKVGTAAAPIDLSIEPGQEDNFVKIIPNLTQDIANLNGKNGLSYDPNFINSLELSILGRIDEAPSEEDLLKAKERQRANLKDILAKLSDPDFIKKLGFIGGVSVNSYSNIKDIVKQGNSVGWRISPMNQMMVKSYLPNATFVTNAWTWERVFNREVIDESQFALEVKVSNDKPKDINSRIQAAAQLGYIDPKNQSKNSWDVYKSIESSLSQAQKIAVAFLSNILNPNSANYTYQKVYDISNTRLIPGKPDVWNDEVNYADNILGIPNKAAQQYLAQSNASQEQNAPSATTQEPQWVPKGNEEIADIIESLSAICSKHCNSTPNTPAGYGLGDTIAHFAEFYAEHYVCPHRQIVQGPLKKATCNAFAIALAAIYGFSVQRKGNDLSGALKDPNFERTLDELFDDFRELVTELNVDLLKKSSKRQKAKRAAPVQAKPVAESIDENVMQHKDITFDEFANLIINGGNVPNNELMEEIDVPDDVNPENIQESFFKMLDKIEHING